MLAWVTEGSILSSLRSYSSCRPFVIPVNCHCQLEFYSVFVPFREPDAATRARSGSAGEYFFRRSETRRNYACIPYVKFFRSNHWRFFFSIICKIFNENSRVDIISGI